MIRTIIPGLYTFEHLLLGRAYLTDDGNNEYTLIDASLPGSGKKIIEQLSASGRAPGSIKRILITHAHPDHIGGLPEMVKATGAQVMAHELEAPLICGEVDPKTMNPADLSPMIRLLIKLPTKPAEVVPVYRTFTDGDVIAESFGGLHVIFSPGHTIGHVCFWQPEKRVLITGDTMMNFAGVRRLPPPLYASVEHNARSIKERLAPLDVETVCFGHGKPIVSGGAAKIRALAAKI